MENLALKVGLIGCGGFGKFCLNAYARMDDIILIAVADVDTNAVSDTTKIWDVKGYNDSIELIKNPDIQLDILLLPQTLMGL